MFFSNLVAEDVKGVFERQWSRKKGYMMMM